MFLHDVVCQGESLALYGAPGGSAAEEEFKALTEAIPGQPGEDYPVYAVPPETSFSCDGYIEGGLKLGTLHYIPLIITLLCRLLC